MLAGEDYLIKPDRMIIRYFYNLGILKNENIDQFNIKIVNEVLNLIVKNLRSEFTHINSKLLDHQIWKFQSNRSSN